MKMILFAIRDTKAEHYAPPFCKPSRGEAERDFIQLSKDEKSVVNKFPQDFDLFELGELDQTSGKIIPHDTPRHMCKAIDFVTK